MTKLKEISEKIQNKLMIADLTNFFSSETLWFLSKERIYKYNKF